MIATKAPKHLRAPTRRWWRSIVDAYELESHDVRILTLACETWDRCTQAREALLQHGTTFMDRFGQPRSRPEVAVERDSKITFARLIRELKLDDDAASEPYGRAPSIGGLASRKRS